MSHQQIDPKPSTMTEVIQTLEPLMGLTGLLLCAFGMQFVMVAIMQIIDGKPNYALECDMTRTLLMDAKYALIPIAPGIALLIAAIGMLRKVWPVVMLMFAG